MYKPLKNTTPLSHLTINKRYLRWCLCGLSFALLFGCQKQQVKHQYGTMAGVGPNCSEQRYIAQNTCSHTHPSGKLNKNQILKQFNVLIKAKAYEEAEIWIKEAMAGAKDIQKLQMALVEVYIRQNLWDEALNVIDKIGLEVNDPVRLTVESRVGDYSPGTDFSLLPQIYKNKLTGSAPQYAVVEKDYLSHFALTRVDDAQPGVPSMEPSIKVSNDGQHIVVAWMDHINFPEYSPWGQKGRSAYSSDGGDSWNMLATGTSDNDLLLVDLDMITAYDPLNNFMYISGMTWSDHFSSNFEDNIFMHRLDLSNGNLVGPFFTQGDDFGNFVRDYDKALLAVEDDGGLYLTTYIPGVVKYSQDFGETFVNMLDLPSGMAHPRVYDDCLYLASQVSPQFWRCDLPKNTSITTPATDNWWGYGDKVSGIFQVHNLTYMARHPNGDLFIVFSELKEVGSDEMVIWMSKSSDNGDTWEAAQIITPDVGGDKFLPWIEIDSAGVIHISYVDTRHNPQADDATVTYIDIYYSHSSDGGETWFESRVTPNSFEMIDWVSYGFTYSDYNELAVGNPDAVFLTFPWGDSGNDMNMYVAKKLKKTDLIFADGFN